MINTSLFNLKSILLTILVSLLISFGVMANPGKGKSKNKDKAAEIVEQADANESVDSVEKLKQKIKDKESKILGPKNSDSRNEEYRDRDEDDDHDRDF